MNRAASAMTGVRAEPRALAYVELPMAGPHLRAPINRMGFARARSRVRTITCASCVTKIENTWGNSYPGVAMPGTSLCRRPASSDSGGIRPDRNDRTRWADDVVNLQ